MMKIETRTIESDKADYIAVIVGKLNARFEALKVANPQGYLDEFTERYELFLVDVAHELGLNVTFENDTCIFSDAFAFGYSKRGTNATQTSDTSSESRR
jgi:hypothetical protein